MFHWESTAALIIITNFNQYSINLLQLDVPVWIHADIVEGPIGAATSPVDPVQYLNASAALENCTVSVGWTTNLSPNETGSYSQDHIKNMTDTIKNNPIDSPVTFALRAALAANSISEISNLLGMFRTSTIAIWSRVEDNVDVEKLRKLIFEVGLNRTYVDVPKSLEERLRLDDPSSGADGVVPLIWACAVGLFLSFLWLKWKRLIEGVESFLKTFSEAMPWYKTEWCFVKSIK